MIGETVGHYRIQAELGSGGMGIVYRAEDLKLGRLVALKFLNDELGDDPSVRDRFLREARAAAALSHPNICTIYEINDSGAQPFIAMELLEGRSLADRLTAGPLMLGEALRLGTEIAEALSAAHHKGLIHRDIKPANIFITADGRAKVVDFGLAKAMEARQAGIDRDQSAIETQLGRDAAVTQRGTTVGTIAYMSPEQARGDALDPRSDIFSFGLVLYEMATGRRAFEGATTALIFDGILNRTPQPPSAINPAVPAELEQVISCTIEKDRARRYQSAADVAGDLRRLQRVSDPVVLASAAPFVPAAAGPVSPGWGVTPARAVATITPPSPVVTQPPAKPAWKRLSIVVPVLLVALAAVGAMIWRFDRTGAVSEGAPVLVADFANRTGDADFDGTLKQALTIKLEESPYLRVMSPPKVQQMLALMARKVDEPVTATIGRDMCQRMGAGALMTGEIARLGSSYVLTLAAESCATGEEIWREQSQARSKEDVLQVLGSQVSAVRQRLGESLASVRAHDKPLVDATTSSLAALRSFSQGDQKRAMGAEAEALPFYQRAIELDPQFALAYARLGTLASNAGEIERAKQFYTKAYELRDRAGDRERLYITSHYLRINGDLSRTREIYELWRQTYPHDFVPVHNLGIYYEEVGDLERALQAFREASAMDPRNPLARESTASTLMTLGRFDEARRVSEQQLKDLGDSPTPHLLLYQLAYLAGDRGAMAQHARKLQTTPLEIEREVTDCQIAMFEGRARDTAGLIEQTAARAESQGRAELARGARTGYVLDRALMGFTREVPPAVNRLMASNRNDPKNLPLAFALGLAGDAARARAIAAPLWPRLQSDAATDRITRPAFEALLEVTERRPARALQLLKDAEPWEERMLKASFVSADVRGMAYLAAGDGRAAEAQFRKRLLHPGLDTLSLSNVLARVHIARARVLAGDVAGARQSYEEFFKLWKNADADIPILQQARAEYERLR